MSDSIIDRLTNAARTASLSWIASLPVLAVGMMCFWAQRDAVGIMGSILKLGALLVPFTFVVPAIVEFVAAGKAPKARVALMGILRGLLIGLGGLVVGTAFLFIEALRPENALGLSGDSFSTGHMIAAVAPSVISLGVVVWSAWSNPAARKPVALAAIVLVAALGPAAWTWSARIAFEAMRYSNTDNSLMLAQAITLAGLAIACIAGSLLTVFRKR
ncbi:MAG: hypothetical protein KJ747_08060 [Actinobacteria bacterium]|nr:hypothetical protein [Actinomycetota bacterium]MCG2807220.1 hypothetical protein [Coriobacteriia bacterium]